MYWRFYMHLNELQHPFELEHVPEMALKQLDTKTVHDVAQTNKLDANDVQLLVYCYLHDNFEKQQPKQQPKQPFPAALDKSLSIIAFSALEACVAEGRIGQVKNKKYGTYKGFHFSTSSSCIPIGYCCPRLLYRFPFVFTYITSSPSPIFTFVCFLKYTKRIPYFQKAPNCSPKQFEQKVFQYDLHSNIMRALGFGSCFRVHVWPFP